MSMVSTTRGLSLRLDRESHRQYHFNSQHWGWGPQCIDTLPHTGLVKYLYYLIEEKNHDSLSNQDQSNLIGKRENFEMV